MEGMDGRAVRRKGGGEGGGGCGMWLGKGEVGDGMVGR